MGVVLSPCFVKAIYGIHIPTRDRFETDFSRTEQGLKLIELWK